ncbi:hypothetical protein IAS59_002763 [Cryptococcus gattii]
MHSSSPTAPLPDIHRVAVTSTKLARRTYGRRSNVHKEKRKARGTEQEYSETSDVDISDDGHEEDELHLSRVKRRGIEVGSPRSKARSTNDTRPVNQANKSTVRIASSISPTPSSRPPSPSPQMKETAVLGQPELVNSGLTRPRLIARARTHQYKPSPDMSTEPRILPSESSASASNRYATRNCGRPLSPSLVNRREISELFSGCFSPHACSYSSVKSGDAQPVPTSVEGVHASSSARSGGLRRMLTKTQSVGASEPSTPSKPDKKDEHEVGPASSWILAAPSTPSRLALRRTQSMPSSPAEPSPQGADIDPAFTAHPQIKQQPGSGGRAKRTYGKVRTIMVELPRGLEDEDQTSYGTMSQGDDSQLQASYVELRQRYEVDNTIHHTNRSASLLHDMLQARAPETVSDMRSRGENRRFIDELGYLFDGISDPAASRSFKRSSAMDILQNMLDEYWLSKMKICGQVDKAWECFIGAGEDEVLESACLVFLCILFVSGSGLEYVVHNDPQNSVSLLLKLLKTHEGPLDPSYKPQVTNSVSKLRKICENLEDNWRTARSSTRYWASCVLNAICQNGMWAATGTELEKEEALIKVLDVLKEEIKSTSDHFDLYEKGLDLQSNERSLDLGYLDHCLRTVLSLTEHSSTQREELLNSPEKVAQVLVDVTLATTHIALTHDSHLLEASWCSLHTVQILAQLGTASAQWAIAVMECEGGPICLARVILKRADLVKNVKDAHEKQLRVQETVLDKEEGMKTTRPSTHETKTSEEELLCYALALFTTSVLADKSFVFKIAQTNIQSGCVGLHACLRHCHCTSAVPVGLHLVYLYNQYSNSCDDPLASILKGNLALLLSKIIGVSAETEDQSLRELGELRSMMQNTVRRLVPSALSMEGRDEEGTENTDAVSETIREVEALL